MIDPDLVQKTEQLRRDGFVVLRGLYDDLTIEAARVRVLDNLSLLYNTRPLASAGHLAGFHRYPVLEPLHTLLSNQPVIENILRSASDCPAMRTIGLTDITVNRSQPWHVDLLRGRYRRFLTDDICWGAQGGGVYKVLLYLQPGRSLKVLTGTHVKPVPLESDTEVEPADSATISSIEVLTGDVVVMDVRLPHRGSTDEELSQSEHLPPKILISTVLGAIGRPLTAAMEKGNFERLLHWDARHDARTPRCSARGSFAAHQVRT